MRTTEPRRRRRIRPILDVFTDDADDGRLIVQTDRLRFVMARPDIVALMAKFEAVLESGRGRVVFAPFEVARCPRIRAPIRRRSATRALLFEVESDVALLRAKDTVVDLDGPAGAQRLIRSVRLIADSPFLPAFSLNVRKVRLATAEERASFKNLTSHEPK